MKHSTTIMITILLAFSAVAIADEIVSRGIVGNSGQEGKTLVRFAEKIGRGMGVVRDRFGSLWDRGGQGRLNRYSPDGRLLALYIIPSGEGREEGD